MFEFAENLDGILSGVLFVLWSVAAFATGRVTRAADDAARRRAARLARVLVLVALVPTVAKVVTTILLWTVAWDFAENRVIVQMPIMLIPLAGVLAWSLPRLWGQARGGPLTGATDPRLVVPVYTTAVSALVGVYVGYVSRPVPSYLDDILTHATPVIAAAAVLWWWRARIHRVARAGGPPVPRPGRWIRLISPALVLVGAAVLAGGASVASRVPDRLSMASHTRVDWGGGPSGGDHHQRTVSVADLTGPRDGEPDVRLTLTAGEHELRLTSGRTVRAWTYDGGAPGPELRFTQGDLVEVTLVNQLPDEGVTIHWHGLNVPNAEDGVAGATQDSVEPGQSYVYRFRAEQAGTFWYHTHQNPIVGVRAGLFGPLIVEPAGGVPEQREITVMPHEWHTGDEIIPAFGAADTPQTQTVAPGTTVRLRLINTDNNPVSDSQARAFVLSGAPYRVVAIDGVDVSGPTELTAMRLPVSTGGRYDLSFTMPATPVHLTEVGSTNTGLTLTPGTGPGEAPPVVDETLPEFTPDGYGTATAAPFGPDSRFDRGFTQILDDRFGFYDGRMHFLPTINGLSFPDAPTLMVREGELVKVRIVNRSHQNHPMHLHGHHALVLTRNGAPVTGSPWWTDSLDVRPGEIYEIGFRADNPGLWMDHCHNLDHANNGMLMHVMYDGVTSPYEVGHDTVNHPE
ncbi:multicopper oxidase family protein [Catenuloplanes atrovinosus]|uniref:FtsP/CotA-like multicopper oxidase with cupredoxin domain n=1 Tax=Catenuloplanes atrovinosus TaxID=137266 RepID=A0AAE3YNJ0_9ACTN|nr:multicopper oxidase family protein [Catenuloplanes atrovinosus]MDR7276800.1 FtsP/CotA-like multicopper oxidase with cupredoxin domain [Catenuloplanes atrovinosus]